MGAKRPLRLVVNIFVDIFGITPDIAGFPKLVRKTNLKKGRFLVFDKKS